MRISGQTLKELRPILTKALENETSVSFTYHEKKRNGPLTDFGFGPQGPFITINQNESYKSFSLLKISDFSVSKPVKETPVNDGFPSDVADFSDDSALSGEFLLGYHSQKMQIKLDKQQAKKAREDKKLSENTNETA